MKNFVEFILVLKSVLYYLKVIPCTVNQNTQSNYQIKGEDVKLQFYNSLKNRIEHCGKSSRKYLFAAEQKEFESLFVCILTNCKADYKRTQRL